MTADGGAWGVVRFEVPSALADEVAGWLAGQAVGGAVRETAGARSLVEIYYPDADAARRACAGLRESLATMWRIDARPVASGYRDEPWVERYQASLKPFPIGRGFLVRPGDEAVEDEAAEGRRAIRLIPGAAFGTGEHPTTRLCAAALERAVEPGSSWLDLGSGSGILALIAERCGARRVLALDNDPTVAEVARRTLDENRCRGVELRTGTLPDALAGERFDGIVSNVARNFFLDAAMALHDGLRPGGRVIVSGFLRGDADAVASALAEAGIACEPATGEGEWAALTGRRR